MNASTNLAYHTHFTGIVYVQFMNEICGLFFSSIPKWDAPYFKSYLKDISFFCLTWYFAWSCRQQSRILRAFEANVKNYVLLNAHCTPAWNANERPERMMSGRNINRKKKIEFIVSMRVRKQWNKIIREIVAYIFSLDGVWHFHRSENLCKFTFNWNCICASCAYVCVCECIGHCHLLSLSLSLFYSFTKWTMLSSLQNSMYRKCAPLHIQNLLIFWSSFAHFSHLNFIVYQKPTDLPTHMYSTFVLDARKKWQNE